MALTTAQQALLLFKKWLGLGQTTSSREFFNETSFPGRSAVYTNQIWTQADLIPNTAPVLTNGQTSGVVQYWQNAPLGAVPGTTNAFTSSLLIDAIPFNYGDGSSYNYVIRNNVGGTIAFGEGDWIVDTDAGLVTFYSTVPANMPPNISFYKYVGAKGFSSGSVPLTGSLFGTASWAENAISSSFATTASAATSITFIPSTASFATTSSFAVTASYALNSTELPPNLVSSSTQIDYTQIQNKPTTIETASYVEYNNVANKPALVSSSQQINTGSFSGSFIGTASFTEKVVGGTSRYIPMWTGSSNAELTSSIIYQLPKGIFVGYDTNPHVHSPEGETLAVHSGETGVKNVIYAHGTFNDDYRVNIRNISSGVSASTNYKATSDVGNDLGGYVQLGINSSTYTRTDQIGEALDAYLYSTGSDLLLGTLSPDKRVIIFTGPGNATNNARVYIDASGSVGINTSFPTTGNPEALIVDALTNSYNLITARANLDNYAQINIKNLSGGNSASADIVATNNIGNETSYYIDMGINSDQYNQPGLIGGPNDAYLYSTGRMLHIGNTTPGEHLAFFVGGFDVEANEKFVLEPEKPHKMIGDFDITGSVTIINDLTVGGTLVAEKFITEYVTSSVIYESGSTKFGDTSDDIHQFTGSLEVLGTISGSLILPSGLFSSSLQVDYNGIQNKPTTIATASYIEYNNVTNKPTLISSSTQVNYTQLSNIPSGILSSSTQFNALTETSASFATTASTATSITFIPTTASFATTSSAATSITFTPTTASFATSASYAPTILPGGIFSSSAQVDYNNIQNKPTTIATASYVEYNNVVNKPTLISSSLQINTGSFSGSITTASFATTASFSQTSSFTVSSSFATTASAATSITFTPPTASFATTASFAQNAQLLNNTSSAILATTGSNSFNGTQTISGSLLLTTDIVVFSGSFTTSGSFAISGSLGVTNGITGSLFGTSSWAQNVISSSFATTASAATSITFTPSSASFSTTASFATRANSLNGGTVNYVPLWSSATAQSSSNLFQAGSNIGIGTTVPLSHLHVLSTASRAFRIERGTNNVGIEVSPGTSTGWGFFDYNRVAYDIWMQAGNVGIGTTTTINATLQVQGNVSASSYTSSLDNAVGFFGTSSWAVRTTTASFATTASAATSITFTPSTASFATTASAATSITFTPTSASFATTASAATSITFTPVTSSYALTASFIDGGFY